MEIKNGSYYEGQGCQKIYKQITPGVCKTISVMSLLKTKPDTWDLPGENYTVALAIIFLWRPVYCKLILFIFYVESGLWLIA